MEDLSNRTGNSPNYLLNGDARIWSYQVPGTPTARSDTQQGADRWRVLTQTAAINAYRGSGPVSSGGGARYSHNLRQNQAVAQRFGYYQILDGEECTELRYRNAVLQGRLYATTSQAIRFALIAKGFTEDACPLDLVNNWASSTYTQGNFFVSTSTGWTLTVGSITPAANTWTPFSISQGMSSGMMNAIVFIWTEGTAAQDFVLQLSELELFRGDGLPRCWQPEPFRLTPVLVEPTLYIAKPYLNGGRITVESGSSIPNADQTAKSNVYWTPSVPEAALSLNLDSAKKLDLSVVEFGLTLASLTADKLYDILSLATIRQPSALDSPGADEATFTVDPGWQTGALIRSMNSYAGFTQGTNYWYRRLTSTTGSFHTTLAGAFANTGKLAISGEPGQLLGISLELSAAWTNDTTRADAIDASTYPRFKSGDLSRRLVGTIRITGTTTTEDSKAKRFTANEDNRARRLMLALDPTDTWTYSTATLREARGQTTNRLQYVVCDDRDLIEAYVKSQVECSTAGTGVAVNIGIDSTTAVGALLKFLQNINVAEQRHMALADYAGHPGVGFHFLSWLEYANGATTTWHGDSGGGATSMIQSGIYGYVNN